MKYIVFIIIFFCKEAASAQSLSIMINVKSSFFKNKEDSLSLALQNQIVESYSSYTKINKQTMYPLNFNTKSKYFFQIVVSDTIIDSERVHKTETSLFEEDLEGMLVSTVLTNFLYEPLIQETIGWATAHIAVFANVSHSINTTPKNIESPASQSQNIVILFEMGKGVKKEHFNKFKAILYNKYNNCQEALQSFIEKKVLKRHCNLFFYDKKMAKISITNPIIITYGLFRKSDSYTMTQNTVGKYTKNNSEFSKEMISKKNHLKINEFEKHPIMRIRDLSVSAYSFMKEVLELE